jgi:hypothetical protein
MMQFFKLIYPLLDGMRVTYRILLDVPYVNGTNSSVITHTRKLCTAAHRALAY